MTLPSVPSPPLPPEILEQIFDSFDQPSLYACSLTCRSWYASSVAFLYQYPFISGANFDSFVAAICPSINAHVRYNGLASLVKVLDMSNLVHNGRKSLTARLLGRMKGSLESFIAPQATFAINSLAALSKCHALRTLNLSLVSEALPHPVLFSSISQLPHLHTLHLPRSFASSSSSSDPPLISTFPPALSALHITGSLNDSALLALHTPAPKTITHTTLASAPQLCGAHITLFLYSVSSTLTSLTLGPNMRRCAIDATFPLGGTIVLPTMPNLREMSVVVTYLYWLGTIQKQSSFPQLIKLTLDADVESSEDDAKGWAPGPTRFADAVEGGMMSRLQIVRVRKSLKQWTWDRDLAERGIWEDWGDGPEGGDVRDRIGRLDALLKEKAREDRDARERSDTGDRNGPSGDFVSETEAGVIFFGPSRSITKRQR